MHILSTHKRSIQCVLGKEMHADKQAQIVYNETQIIIETKPMVESQAI